MTTSAQDVEPAWRCSLNKSVGLQGTIDCANKQVEVPYPAAVQSPSPLQLGQVPAGWTVVLSGLVSNQVSLPPVRGVSTGVRLLLRLAKSSSTTAVHIEGELGLVELHGDMKEAFDDPIKIVLQKAATVLVHGVSLSLEGGVVDCVEIDNGQISGTGTGSIGELHLNAGISRLGSGLHIGRLSFDDTAELVLAGGRTFVREVASRSGMSSVVLIHRGGGNSSSLAAVSATNLSCRVGESFWLEISQEAENLKLCGEGSVHFASGAAAKGVHFDGVVLRADTDAFLTGLSGHLILQSAQGAHLTGDPKRGFTVVDIQRWDAKPYDGTVLNNVIIPHTQKGRRQLKLLEESAHFTPNLAALPMFGATYRRPFARSHWKTPVDLATTRPTPEIGARAGQLNDRSAACQCDRRFAFPSVRLGLRDTGSSSGHVLRDR